MLLPSQALQISPFPLGPTFHLPICPLSLNLFNVLSSLSTSLDSLGHYYYHFLHPINYLTLFFIIILFWKTSTLIKLHSLPGPIQLNVAGESTHEEQQHFNKQPLT